MQLETDRLVLKPYDISQAGRVQQLAGEEDVARTTFVPHPYPLETAKEWISSHKEWIESKQAYPLAMMRKEDGELVGTMTLRVSEKHQKGELAYWVGKPYWGQGYATEAAQKIVEFGFETLNLHRIWAGAFPENPASTRVMQKCGLVYEGTMKDDMYHWGKFRDIAIYGLVRNE
ncbi:N-acetyltransferase [Halobacillus fulvus]|nr:N-acetyltransferase [Halobacillus fulvus]